MQLKDIHSPDDIRGLSYEETEQLAAELRRQIINRVSRNGGHLASNLGVVELTIALHRSFRMPEDKIVFDVGHQCYVHKLLTGRFEQFETLRQYGGMSGFPKRKESPCDVFETGHSSTAISAALGMARARDLRGEKHQVVAVVGDGALTGGMCYEAMNDAGSSNTRLIVVLNDNEMSISQNVGALSRHLTDLRISKGWTSTKRVVKSRLARVPLVGKPLYHFLRWSRNTIKSMFVDDDFFHALGFRYYGPVNGHDIASMERVLQKVQDLDRPVLVHVITRKGNGYAYSEEEPDRFHGIAPFDEETGDVRKRNGLPSFGEVMAEELADEADHDERIVTVTAAMMTGTGLDKFAQRHPKRMFDVGITEPHAATMCAGMAAAGMKPYFAVYASFFQRSYDQMIHDVAMQNLPVTFLLDRAGLVGEDGPTHHGVFDFASTQPVPNMTVLAPRDLEELRVMLRWTREHDGPVAIRYGRQSVSLSEQYPCDAFKPGRWDVLENGDDVTLLAVGSMVPYALEARKLLQKRSVSAKVVSCSTVKPLDEKFLSAITTPCVTIEEHVLTGGFGSSVLLWAAQNRHRAPVAMLGVPDRFIEQGTRAQLLRMLGLDGEGIAQSVFDALKEKNHE